MAVNDKTDAIVKMVLRNQIKPRTTSFGTHAGFTDDNTGPINDELQSIEDAIRLLAENSMQSADAAPSNPKRGQIRYAVSPWDPTGSGNGPVVYNGSSWVTLVGATGATGSTGAPGNNANSSNNTQVFLYQVNTSSSTAPSTVNGNFTYDFSDATIVAQSGANFNGWLTYVPTVPQGSFLWVISAYAVGTTETVTVAASAFTTAKVMAASGSDGSDGAQGIQGNPGVNAVDGDDGRSVAQLQIYKRSSSAITSAPTGGSFNFTNQTLTPPTGWNTSVPSGTDPIYTSLASAQIVGNEGTDSSLTWSTPVVLSQNGTNGNPGDNGKSTFQALIFQRATSAPSSPSGGSFNFGTNVLTAPSGWSISIPSGSDPIYVCNFQFSITGDTGSQTAGTWGTVRLMAQDGSDGADGRSTYLATVFRRDANTPSTPTGGQYNFTTNTLTAPTGWYTTIPSGTNTLYGATALASVLGPTGIDTSLTWTVGKLAQDGATGATGLKSTSGLIYYTAAQANPPSTPVPSNSVCVYSFSSTPPGFGSTLPTNWTETPPTVNTQSAGSYWQARFTAIEASSGGSVTVTVATPTKVFTFDGIVRFSNSNNRVLEQTNSGGTTTISSLPTIFRQNIGNSTSGYTFPQSKNIGDIIYATDWGYTTFISTVAGSSTDWVQQDLASAINNANNTTTIDGGNITTGTISANQVNTSALQAELVTASVVNALDINASSITTGSLTLDRLTVTGAQDGYKLSFNSSSGNAEWKPQTTETIFNSSGSYTVPNGTNFVVIQIWGAGGNGNSAVGGGGGAYQRIVLLASDISSAITVTVGTGGQGGNNFSQISFTAAIGGTAIFKSENGDNGNGPFGPEDETSADGGDSVTSSHSIAINRITEGGGDGPATYSSNQSRSYAGTGGRSSGVASGTSGVGGRGGNSSGAAGAAPGGGGAYGSGSGAAGRVTITVN